jgi:hypothetical protein
MLRTISLDMGNLRNGSTTDRLTAVTGSDSCQNKERPDDKRVPASQGRPDDKRVPAFPRRTTGRQSRPMLLYKQTVSTAR